jgi:hypothetical protein
MNEKKLIVIIMPLTAIDGEDDPAWGPRPEVI